MPARPRFPPPARRGPKTGLFDIQGRQLAGDTLQPDPDSQVSVPVMFAGAPVAELQAIVDRRVASPLETAFSARQARTSALIGAIALALAAVASWLLARALLAPVKASIASVASL